MREQQERLRATYRAFNQRDIPAVLAQLHRDVVWPNGMEGGYVYGHDEVRAYWTRQWAMIDPHVEPVSFALVGDGRIAVDVHQVVRDLEGNLLTDQMVRHVYEIDDGLVRRMEIEHF